MKRGIAIVCLLLVASSATACGDDDGGSRGENAADATASGTPADDSAGSGDGPRLVLHDTGAEPRRVLSAMPAEGASDHATMTMNMGMKLTLDGEPQPSQAVPPMSFGMAVEVTEVAANGDVTSRFEYDETDVVGGGAAVRQLEATLAQLEGITGTFRVSGTGEFIEAEIDVPEDVDPLLTSTLDSFESQLSNLCPPVPDEAVGVGASWTVHTTSALNGIEADTTYEYTVVELRDDAIVLDVSYEQTARPQEIEAPGLPAGSTLHLESMATSGTGQVTVEPGRLLPVASHTDGGGTIRMTAEADGEELAMVQEMEIGMELQAD